MRDGASFYATEVVPEKWGEGREAESGRSRLTSFIQEQWVSFGGFGREFLGENQTPFLKNAFGLG